MDIKTILDIEVEELTTNEILASEDLENVLACGISSGTGTCGHR